MFIQEMYKRRSVGYRRPGGLQFCRLKNREMPDSPFIS